MERIRIAISVVDLLRNMGVQLDPLFQKTLSQVKLLPVSVMKRRSCGGFLLEISVKNWLKSMQVRKTREYLRMAFEVLRPKGRG